MSANLIFDHPTDMIAVARFARPDVREALYHFGHERHDDYRRKHTLYRELLDRGDLQGLPTGGRWCLELRAGGCVFLCVLPASAPCPR